MFTRRSFLWQMLGAGLWATIARWFKKEPIAEEEPIIAEKPKGQLIVGEAVEWPDDESGWYWEERYEMVRAHDGTPIAFVRMGCNPITPYDVYDLRMR